MIHLKLLLNINKNFLTNYILCLYPELKECTNIDTHHLIESKLNISTYKTKNYYYWNNAILKKKNDIFVIIIF